MLSLLPRPRPNCHRHKALPACAGARTPIGGLGRIRQDRHNNGESDHYRFCRRGNAHHQTPPRPRAFGPSPKNQALTHRSFATPHNERLEFLGDALLNCAIATLLYERFANLPEGDLSTLETVS